MNVGVLGRGMVGQRLAAAFDERGHDLMIGTSDPSNEELQSWLAGEGAGVRAGTLADVSAFGELLVIAVLGNAAEGAIAQAGPERSGSRAPRELEAMCILWVKLGVRRGAWDHGFKLLVG
jgi:predicted dinucleotide-binding enzyme